ncbi:MAG: phage tail family protein [Oscillospiraceae bacterium]|nr:phage tail family protein [Oscillospiraceae bacterium]
MDYKLIVSDEDGNSVDFYSDPNIFLQGTVGTGADFGIVTDNIYGYDGSKYRSSSLNSKSIAITARIRAGGGQTAEQAKLRLMRLFGHKGKVRVRHVSPSLDCYINGYIEKADAPENVHPLIMQVVINCPQPYWIDSAESEKTISGTENLWEFAVELTDEGMEFGQIMSSLVAVIENKGQFDSGGIFRIVANTVCSNPRLENIYTGEFIQVKADMVSGDVIEICTKPGQKSIYFTHGGERKNYFNYRTDGSSFFPIYKGQNSIRYSVGSGGDHAIDVTVDFETRYGGI